MPQIELDFSYSISDALQCLANEEHLALLDSNGQGGSILCWGQQPRDCTLSELNINHGTAQKCPGAWPLDIRNGALVQIDYEFPVGAWAATSSHPGKARLWDLKRYLHWQNDTCVLHTVSEEELHTTIQQLQNRQALPIDIEMHQTLNAQLNYADYETSINAIHDYIAQGDIYQVNFTMPFIGQLKSQTHQDIALYLKLRQHSPAPYSAFFRFGPQSIISHSPECFLSSFNYQCHSHPIKGTRKRTPGSEQALREELRLAEKDKAELDMIIDLVRNDLGRVAVPGSVQVTQEREIIDLPYVHHAVGHIQCLLNKDIQHQDLLAACFPPGSITGAPKIRAMQIINELEQQIRGAYCGCFGWLGADAACELAVGIRTMQIQQQHIRVDAGGGIVSDSHAQNEWQELNDKASAMRSIVEGKACAKSS